MPTPRLTPARAAGLCLAALGLAGAAGCDAAPAAPAGPRAVTAISAALDTGTFTHDVVLRNDTGQALGDVDVVLTLYRTDGGRPELKQFWGR